jgi:putative nucleotidyltransferase with HDIG domain
MKHMSHSEKKKESGVAFFERTHYRSETMLFLLFGTSLLIALLLFPNLLVTVPRYQAGDVVQKDIKAPKDFLIEDKEATQTKREEAAQLALSIYDLDDGLSAKLANSIAQAFEHMRNLASGDKPGVTGQEQPINGKDNATPTGANAPVSEPVSPHDLIWKEKENFENMLGIQISSDAYKILEKENFSEAIPEQISQLLRTALQNGIVANKQLLLQERDKGVVVRRLSSKEELSVGNLRKFYSLEEAHVAIANTGREVIKDVSYSVRKLIVDMAQRLTQPNLTLNRRETEERRERLVAEVKAVLTQVKQGEMLLREGEKVTENDIVKLNALESETISGQLFTSGVGFVLLAMMFFVISFDVNLKVYGAPAINNRDLLFLCLMLIILFFLSEVSASLATGIAGSTPYSIEASSLLYAIPVATGSMTVCLFMGLRIALPFSLAMAFVVAFLFENPFDMFLFFLLSSMVGTYWVRTCKERGTLIKAALKVGLVNMLVVTALHMFKGSGFDLNLVWDWTFSFAGGVSSGILATGFAPVVEMMFGYTTDIKLLELANLDRPILRKLMLEAPGTYHHSVVVGSLVEAAADAVGANPLLAKASGYYHDVGKIRKPLYFIENQVGGENKHDKLAPSMSSLILIAHVKDGVEIARNHKLGRAIIDIIQQHHGTSLITYFYEKARQLKGEDAVNMEHFRHPGPKPQTKEAGLVLMADAVEAASRSLENPTPARIKGLVQKIINKLFLDGQLDECELTLRDLHEIARSFNQLLTGIHHHRIQYPDGEAGVDTGNNRLNGNSDRRQAGSSQDGPQEDPEEGKGNLKRLGMS